MFTVVYVALFLFGLLALISNQPLLTAIYSSAMLIAALINGTRDEILRAVEGATSQD